MLNVSVIQQVLPTLRGTVINGSWYRQVSLNHVRRRMFNPLSVGHTANNPGRYNPRGLSVLYLAETRELVDYETRRILPAHGRFYSVPGPPVVTFTYEIVLQNVLELSKDICNQIHTSYQELTGNWNLHGPGLAPTQFLGQSVHDFTNYEALKVPSALTTQWNLIIFLDRLRRGSYVHSIGFPDGKYDCRIDGNL